MYSGVASHPPRVLRALFAGALLLAALPSAAHVHVFGPKTYTSSQGGPQTVTESITLAGPCDLTPNAQYTLVVASDGVASASVSVNGTEVVKENDFNQQASTIERSITLAATNTLRVTIKGGSHPGSLTIAIRRHIDSTVAVFAEKTFTTTGKSDQFSASFNVANPSGNFEIVVRSGAGAAAVKSGSVRLNGVEVVRDQDLKASAVVTKSVTLAASNQLVIDTKSDGAGASLSVAIVRHLVDTTAPQIVPGVAEGQIIGATPYTISGNVTDASGVATFTINGTPVIPGAGGTFSTSIALVEGPNTIVLDATDCEGNAAHREVHVVLELAPSLTIVTPQPNALRDTLTIAVSGTVTSTKGVQSVTANGTAMTVSDTSWSGSVTLPAGDGPRDITVVATDTAGRQTTRVATVRIDTTAPVVTIASPAIDGISIFLTSIRVSGVVSDLGGVASLSCNGVSGVVEEGFFVCAAVPLHAGANTITVSSTDVLGHASSTARSVLRVDDTAAPTITAQLAAPNEFGWHHEPVNVKFLCADDRAVVFCSTAAVISADGASQVVSGRAVDGAGHEATTSATASVDTTAPAVDVDGASEVFTKETTLSLRGTASDATSGLHNVVCGATPATINGNAFQCNVPLTSGWQSIYVTAQDRAGNTRSTRVSAFHDAVPPALSVEPATPIVTNSATVTISGVATDDDHIASVTINGVAAILDLDGAFIQSVQLAEGEQSLVIRATDRAGNFAVTQLAARYVRRPSIRITAPPDFSVTNLSSVTVSGVVEGPIASVNVNGVPATVSGSNFTAANVPLAQGRTNVTAFAATPAGEIATAQLNLFRDSIPPRVAVYAPAADAVVTSSPVTVSGMVDDIVIGTINAGQMRVTVNGINADVANRAFQAKGIALSAGQNVLSIVATDQAGNRATISHRITLNASAPLRVGITGGDAQTARIGVALPQPLAVRVTNGSGAGVPGSEVLFEVTQNDGVLTANTQSGRSVTVITDSTGAATVRWTLGNRAGAGNNVVRASAGGAPPAFFHATGQTGSPALVVVDSGDNQFGVSNERLQRPLAVAVVDAGSNRLAGVPVTFSVLEGGGSFNGASSITVTSDSDGRAWATPQLGPSSGAANNAFAAAVAGVQMPAMFRVTGRVAGPAAETRISGVVLDNSNIPIAGVTMRIDETNRSVRTDAQGQFVFDHAPVGYLKLIADGTTAERPGTWPMLEFVLYTNAGQNNTIGMPVYMLPIDVTRGIQVTETTGGTLTIPELPGFALTVKPGSALFPNGSRAGTVSATLVHSDKVPMTPGFGQQPRFIVTIQPPGVHFDPPAALTLPNLDGLRPGEVTEMYSFDHDLGQFVAIGTASASSDGSTIISDPGVGIIKGGWHCGGAPNPTGSTCTVTLDGFAEITDEGGDPTDLPPGQTAATLRTDSVHPEKALKPHASGPSIPVGLVGTCATITAKGNPILGLFGNTLFDGHYHDWQIVDDPADPNDHANAATFVSAPNCTSATQCVAKIRGQMAKVATVQVKFTVGSATAVKTFKVRFVSINPSVVELSLSGDDELTLYEDNVAADPDTVSGNNWVTPIQDPVWKDTFTSAQIRPSAFPKDDDVEAKVKFRLIAPLPVPLPNVRVVGDFDIPGPIPGTPLTMRFRSDVITIPAGTTTFEVDDIETGFKPLTTMYLNPMSIRWRIVQVNNSGCPMWVDAGTTNVPVYYTLREPHESNVLRTAVHLAVADIYESTEAGATQALWRKFSIGDAAPANVRNWKGMPLKYYPPGVGFDRLTSINPDDGYQLLLSTGFSGCFGFQQLFMLALDANGISSTATEVMAREGDQFMVKKWDLGAPVAPPSDPWRFQLVLLHPGQFETMVPEPADHLFGKVLNLPGVPGQNSPWPAEKVFQNHQIVRLHDGRYVDTSYGLVYSSEIDFQQKAVEGYAKRQPGQALLYFFVRKPDPSTNNIEFH